MTTIAEISNALENRIFSLPSPPEFAFQNDAYKPKADTDFLRITQIPFEPVQIGMADDSGFRRDGLLQIDINVPYDTGRIESDAIIEKIMTHFPVGLELFTATDSYKIRIKKVAIEIGEVTGSHYVVPVLIHYWAVVH